MVAGRVSLPLYGVRVLMEAGLGLGLLPHLGAKLLGRDERLVQRLVALAECAKLLVKALRLGLQRLASRTALDEHRRAVEVALDPAPPHALVLRPVGMGIAELEALAGAFEMQPTGLPVLGEHVLGLDSLTGLGTTSLAIPDLPPVRDPTIAEFGWAVVIGVAAAVLGTGIRRLGQSLRPGVERRRPSTVRPWAAACAPAALNSRAPSRWVVTPPDRRWTAVPFARRDGDARCRAGALPESLF